MIGIFGGTFDPIHCGHLRTGLELMQALELAELRWIPVGNPGHRKPPRAPAALRLDMVRAAIAGQPGFVLDEREIHREGVSYTVDTLNEIRRHEMGREGPQRPLCLLLGMDAFSGFHGWHRWREILDVAHLIVATRPGCRMPTEGPIAALLAERRATESQMLQTAACGLIHVRPVTSLEISSTELRELLQRGGDPRYLVPEAVRTMIIESGCYAAPQV